MNNVANWVTFGKDRYHQQGEMYNWCNENIGPGGWTYETPKTWEGMGNNFFWVMHSMFGNTTYAFKDKQHLTMFLLRWS